MKEFKCRIITERCILRFGHNGLCEYNNFDPPALFDQCHRRLAQIEGDERDGEWLPLTEIIQ